MGLVLSLLSGACGVGCCLWWGGWGGGGGFGVGGWGWVGPRLGKTENGVLSAARSFTFCGLVFAWPWVFVLSISARRKPPHDVVLFPREQGPKIPRWCRSPFSAAPYDPPGRLRGHPRTPRFFF